MKNNRKQFLILWVLKTAYIDWMVVNANEDAYTWARSASGGNFGPAYMRCNANSAMAADDWLISSKISLTAGTAYWVSFYINVNTGSNLLSCFVGNAQSVANMNTELWSGIITNSATYQYIGFPFTPSATDA